MRAEARTQDRGRGNKDARVGAGTALLTDAERVASDLKLL